MIGFGLQSATKIFKKWITKCDGITNHEGLQSDTVQQSYQMFDKKFSVSFPQR